MRIKKNGKTINLTESDIKKISKTILKEQQIGYGESTITDLEEVIALMSKRISRIETHLMNFQSE